ASMLMAPSGMPMFQTSVVCASAKEVRCCRRSMPTAAALLVCSEALTGRPCSSLPRSGVAWRKLARLHWSELDSYSPWRRARQASAGHEGCGWCSFAITVSKRVRCSCALDRIGREQSPQQQVTCTRFSSDSLQRNFTKEQQVQTQWKQEQ